MISAVEKLWFKYTQLKMREELLPFYKGEKGDRYACKQEAVPGL